MSSELEESEGVGQAVRRVMAAHLAATRQTLSTTRQLDEAVHLAHKSLKHCRAILALARCAIPREHYDRQKNLLREAARPLAQIRDAYVLVETFDRIAGRRKTKLDLKHAAAFRRLLVDRRRTVRRTLVDQQRAMAAVSRQIATLLRSLPDLPVSATGQTIIRRGVSDSWREARQAMKRAARRHDPETMHAWRRRVQRQSQQLEFLAPLQRRQLRPISQRAAKLASVLGEHHDLAVLDAVVVEADLPGRFIKRLRKAIQRRQKTLADRAKKRGRKLLAAKSRVLVRPLVAEWKRREAPSDRASSATGG